MSWMNVNAPTPGVSRELVRYVRSEFGEDAYYARAMVERGTRSQSARIPNETGGLLRRFVATISQTFAAVRASPGGA